MHATHSRLIINEALAHMLDMVQIEEGKKRLVGEEHYIVPNEGDTFGKGLEDSQPHLEGLVCLFLAHKR